MSLSAAVVVASALALLGGVSGCQGCLKRVPVDHVKVRPYPTCDGKPLPPGDVVSKGFLRSGPYSLDQHVAEHYVFRRRGCVYVATVHQDWPLEVTDVQVVYDLHWKPLRVWKRATLPSDPRIDDVRLYELRNDPPTMTRRSNEDGLEHFVFRGPQPVAVIGPGRGLIEAWIRANPDLQPGGIVRGPVLDFRARFEKIEHGSLRRNDDRDVPELGRVRVYTVLGRESVFTDDDLNVVGDLSGLRPDAVLKSPTPEPLEERAPLDPTAPLD